MSDVNYGHYEPPDEKSALCRDCYTLTLDYGYCVLCGAPVCDDCSKVEYGNVYCGDCDPGHKTHSYEGF